MAKKKSARRAKSPQISLLGTIPKVQLTMPLDARKIAALVAFTVSIVRGTSVSVI